MYDYTTNYGGGVVLAPAGSVFLGEVARAAADGLLPGITNLGELGNSIHVAEGWTNSDHNPFVKNPAGLSYVRAFDFGGPVSTWVKLIEFWNYRYGQQDARVYWPGYTNSDQPPPHGLTIWYSAGLTRQGTDGPHAHLSLGRANTNTSGVAAWTPALDSLEPWGLHDFLTGNHTTSGGTATPVTSEEDELSTVTDQITAMFTTVGNIGSRLTDMAGELGEVRARVARVFPDSRAARVTDSTGAAKAVPAGTANSVPNVGLDEVHGNVFVRAIRAAASADQATAAKVDSILAELTKTSS